VKTAVETNEGRVLQSRTKGRGRKNSPVAWVPLKSRMKPSKRVGPSEQSKKELQKAKLAREVETDTSGHEFKETGPTEKGTYRRTRNREGSSGKVSGPPRERQTALSWRKHSTLTKRPSKKRTLAQSPGGGMGELSTEKVSKNGIGYIQGTAYETDLASKKKKGLKQISQLNGKKVTVGQTCQMTVGVAP